MCVCLCVSVSVGVCVCVCALLRCISKDSHTIGKQNREAKCVCMLNACMRVFCVCVCVCVCVGSCIECVV